MAERTGIIKGNRIYLENGLVFEQAHPADLLGDEAQYLLQNDRRCLGTAFKGRPVSLDYQQTDQNRINELPWPEENGKIPDRRWNPEIRKEDMGF